MNCLVCMHHSNPIHRSITLQRLGCGWSNSVWGYGCLRVAYVLLLLFSLSTSLYAQKTVKVKGVEGRWQVSDNITLKEAEERARLEAKKEALRRAGVMENVWSAFGQITKETGSEFKEIYSQMNILAIGGMMNVTQETVKEVWDTNTSCLYKVVTIDAEIKQGEQADMSYALEVQGVSTLYREGDVFTCSLKVRGTDSYLKFFWFDSNGGELFYPNEYEGNALLKAEQNYPIPFNPTIEYKMSKEGNGESEQIYLMMVATKENIPFTEKVTFESVLKWIYSIPANKRCAFFDTLLIK